MAWNQPQAAKGPRAQRCWRDSLTRLEVPFSATLLSRFVLSCYIFFLTFCRCLNWLLNAGLTAMLITACVMEHGVQRTRFSP